MVGALLPMNGDVMSKNYCGRLRQYWAKPQL